MKLIGLVRNGCSALEVGRVTRAQGGRVARRGCACRHCPVCCAGLRSAANSQHLGLMAREATGCDDARAGWMWRAVGVMSAVLRCSGFAWTTSLPAATRCSGVHAFFKFACLPAGTNTKLLQLPNAKQRAPTPTMSYATALPTARLTH
jgi:hypothetical protein